MCDPTIFIIVCTYIFSVRTIMPGSKVQISRNEVFPENKKYVYMYTRNPLQGFPSASTVSVNLSLGFFIYEKHQVEKL
jgi:hypothetical protein